MFKAILFKSLLEIILFVKFMDIKVFNGIFSSGDECSAALLGKEEPLSSKCQISNFVKFLHFHVQFQNILTKKEVIYFI